MTSVSLRLPDDVAQRLDALAARTGRSKTFYMMQAICQQLEDFEDLYDAEQALIESRASGEQEIPIEDLMKSLGMEPRK